MKIHRVEMTAFGPFRDTEVADFDAFDADGLFLIAGRTGSGKTSILDAVCFALYGDVPRYPTMTEARLRSDYAAPEATPQVTLEFSAGGKRYRIERTPQHDRVSTRGLQRTVTKQATVALSVREGDEWAGISTLARDVGDRIANDIVRLTATQFLQVILLAQNRFQEFLVADSKDRRDLLRKIFGTQRFNDYVEDLRARTGALDAEAAESRRVIGLHVEQLAHLTGRDPADIADAAHLRAWLEEIVGDETARVERARSEEQRAADAATAAAAELERQRTVRRHQERRDDATRERDVAEAEADEIAELVAAIKRAQRADVAWPTVERHRKAAAGAAAAGDALELAAVAYETVRTSGRASLPDADADLAEIDAAAGALQSTIGALSEARTQEQRLPALADAAQDARDAVVQQAAERQRLTDRLADIDAQTGALAVRIAELRATAADVEPAHQHYTATNEAHDAAKYAVDAAADLDVAQATRAVRAQEAQKAVQHRADLWQRRLDGYAASLAKDLDENDACPVCGSTTHPELAASTEQSVTDAMLKVAEAGEQKALDAATSANQAVADADKVLSGYLAKSGSRTVEELEDALGLASARLETAQKAREDLLQADAKSTQLDELRTGTTTERDALDTNRDQLNGRAAAAETTRDAAQGVVDTARGEFASVHERIERLIADRAAVVALVDARRTMADADGDARDAETELAATLTEQGFDSADAVRDSRLIRAVVAAHEQRVATHRETLAGTAKVLADPDLQDLPLEQIDLTGAQEAAELHDAACRAMAGALGTAETRAGTATSFVAAITTALDASADVTARLAVVRRLFASVNGEPPNDRKMKLEDFVLAAKLEEIVEAANVRLTSMTEGRYALQYSDAVQAGGKQSGLSIEVLDTHTGAPRPTHSLSGGEKFLASLALALGLAETVTARAGGITLDTLFIDEGFGSLDSETLEIAMETLDKLRAGGRTIGVISHVAEMHDRIPARLDVDVVDGGWSVIHQG